MSKVMVFRSISHKSGAEWYSRGGAITVRNAQELSLGEPERKSSMTHEELHNSRVFAFVELRHE